MVEGIIKAIIFAGLPVGILGYLLVTWSLRAGRLSAEGDGKKMKAELKAMQKAQRKKKTKTKNPVHNKWMRFGGGFYGAVGLYTFLIIEIEEIVEFSRGYEDVDTLMASFGDSSLVSTAIAFFINSLKNFIAAIAWPGFWTDFVQGQMIAIWLGITYGAYWLGTQIARNSNISSKTSPDTQ